MTRPAFILTALLMAVSAACSLWLLSLIGLPITPKIILLLSLLFGRGVASFLNAIPNETMDDNSKMPFGKHKGEKLANVPADYLLWLYDNNKADGELKLYIEDCMDVLRPKARR